MREYLGDRRIRQLLVAVLLVILALGLLSLLSTLFQLIVPLAIVAGGGFAFYKIVLEGRDRDVDADEGTALDMAEPALVGDDIRDEADSIDQIEADAQQRLSATARAQREYFEQSTPAEEIIAQIQRRQRQLRTDD